MDLGAGRQKNATSKLEMSLTEITWHESHAFDRIHHDTAIDYKCP